MKGGLGPRDDLDGSGMDSLGLLDPEEPEDGEVGKRVGSYAKIQALLHENERLLKVAQLVAAGPPVCRVCVWTKWSYVLTADAACS
jgi:hypothetical protein